MSQLILWPIVGKSREREREKKNIQGHHHFISESHRAQLSTNQRVRNRFVIVKLEFDKKQLGVL